MQLPLQVSFRHMERSTELETIIREKAAKLDTFAGRITSCRVVVEPAGKHRRNGNEYGVKIDVKLPGGELVATHKHGGRKENKDIRVATREAFNAAARQLEDYVRMQRGDVKAHQHEDTSFPVSPNGEETVVHRTSLRNDPLDQLELDAEVA